MMWSYVAGRSHVPTVFLCSTVENCLFTETEIIYLPITLQFWDNIITEMNTKYLGNIARHKQVVRRARFFFSGIPGEISIQQASYAMCVWQQAGRDRAGEEEWVTAGVFAKNNCSFRSKLKRISILVS
jgi:hypothetical protein